MLGRDATGRNPAGYLLAPKTVWLAAASAERSGALLRLSRVIVELCAPGQQPDPLPAAAEVMAKYGDAHGAPHIAKGTSVMTTTRSSERSAPAVLVCTVGGSHEPVLTAIREHAPAYVCFVCTGADPATGQPGSDRQVLGKGSVIKASREDEHPSLRNIPVQAGLDETAFGVVRVPADDLDAGFAAIHAAIASLRECFPDARLIADYTGGTKTMSAALVLAALEFENIDLGLVTGARADLVQVRDGTEHGALANVVALRAERAARPLLGAWQRFAYDEAAAGLARISAPGGTTLEASLQRAVHLSQAFAAWDLFDHDTALGLLDAYRPRIGGDLHAHLGALRTLTREGDAREPQRLLDLWANAERRAHQGRYDDAVARLYRLLEWTAQWLLESRKQIRTTDIAESEVPEGMCLRPNREGKRQAGLLDAWRLVAWHLPDTAGAGFFDAQQRAMLDRLELRNHSLLAHGKRPVSEADWKKFHDWARGTLLPALLDDAKAAGVHKPPPQLPARYEWWE